MAKTEKVSFDQVMTDLRKKVYSPVYLLMGEEAYYIDLISDFIQKNVLIESEKEFDQTILYGKDVDIRTVINAAKRYPMLSKYQVIIVKEAQLIKDWDDITHYLKQPLQSTILVLCYKYGTPDKRKKWVLDGITDTSDYLWDDMYVHDVMLSAQYSENKDPYQFFIDRPKYMLKNLIKLEHGVELGLQKAFGI